MSDRPLRVLLIKESEADTKLVTHELERAGIHPVTERLGTREGLAQALHEFAPDVVLSDYSLAQFDIVDDIAVVRDLRPSVPVIVVTGALSEEMAVACLRAGAEDYIVKGNLGRLAPAIEAALSSRQLLRTLSPRQVQVLRLVAEGRSTREIAQRLQLSAKTVATHRGEIMKRLGIHDVVGLVRYAVRVSLVSTDG